jgi:hypothetical protein
MPPKKKTGTTTDGEGAEGGVSHSTPFHSIHPPVYLQRTKPPSQKFTWEGPNDTKLLLLTQGRYVKTDEYENLATAMGTSSPFPQCV